MSEIFFLSQIKFFSQIYNTSQSHKNLTVEKLISQRKKQVRGSKLDQMQQRKIPDKKKISTQTIRQ